MEQSTTEQTPGIPNPASGLKPVLIRADDIGVLKSSGRQGAPSSWIIRHVDVTLHAGEIVTLVGPNGGGKSTTVHALLGLIKPDEGRIEKANGVEIGYVPQRLTIDPTLPLSVNRFMRLTRSASERQIENALQRTGAGHLARSPLQNLSSGEFQRVLLARAIASQPQVLVLDEPVSGVDVQGEQAIYRLIDEIRQDLNCGILLVSHDLHVVMAQSDQVICLNGHVCCQGSPGEVLDHQNYQNLFGKQDAEFIAFYQHDHDHTHDDCGDSTHRHDSKDHSPDA